MSRLSSIHRTILTALLAVAFAMGSSSAHADCSNKTASDGIASYGVTAGIVYCIQQTISDAVTGSNTAGVLDATHVGFIQQLSSGLASYRYVLITFALTMFGIKLATAGVKEVTKEAMVLIFKIGIIIYFINNAGLYYNSITSIMGQMISWVNTGFAAVTQNCTAAASSTPPTDYSTQYDVWRAFDCMFGSMFGAVANHPEALMTGMLAIVAIALFSGSVGVIVVMMAITAFVSAVLTLARALYLVLLSYLTLAFLVTLTPLVMPIWIFDNQKTKDIFENWVGLIISTMFQPIFVIGFLSMAVMTMDVFIEGSATTSPAIPMASATNPNGCVVPPHIKVDAGGNCVYPLASEPIGKGVCSFKQLFNPEGYTDTQLQKATNCYIEKNATLFSWTITGDPQAHNDDGSWWGGLKAYLKKAATAVVNKVMQLAAAAGNLAFSGFERLKPFAPLEQLMTTLVAFILSSIVMLKLMDVIPEMARSITISVGVGLYSQAKVPLEGVIAAGIKKGGDKMKELTAGKGLAHGNLGGVTGIARAGVGGIAAGMRGSAQHISEGE